MSKAETAINELKAMDEELGRFGVVVYRGKSLDVQKVRKALVNAVALIEEQDITIRALMGEFGDSCDSGCKGA